MSTPQTRAELEKLARALQLEGTEAIDALEVLAPADVRALRHAVTDMLLEADLPQFTRVAAFAKAVPVKLAAKLAEDALGPLLAARLAALVDVGLAGDIVRRLSAGFLADVAVELDPRQAHEVIGELPPDLIAAAAAELDQRDEHIAMSMIVGHLSPEALAAVVEVLSTHALLRVGFLIEAPERLDELVALLPDGCLAEIALLASEEDRWDEIDGIEAHLSPEQLARLRAQYDVDEAA